MHILKLSNRPHALKPYSFYPVFLFLCMLMGVSAQAQQSTETVGYTKNKVIPASIEREVKMALAYYPELADTPIEFVFKSNIRNSFMQAQPKWYGFFQSAEKRSYVIKISPELVLEHETIPVEELPQDVLVGWLGHELGHISDYSTRSGFAMLGFGLRYITSDSYKIGAEKAADIHAILHGLADHIVANKNFILTYSGISPTYRRRIKRLYMSPELVLQLVEKWDAGEELLLN